MLEKIIRFSIANKFFILIGAVALIFAGFFALRRIPIDALPDLSDTQVIIFTQWQGQPPQIIQDQITYPITTQMVSIPKSKAVRGYSYYNFSFVYVIFEDGTDPYWARSRVLEYLSGLQSRLPSGVTPSLGPDATGVGWAFMYTIDSKDRDLAQLRTIQDWYLKYRLSAIDGVSEVASIGGFVKQYQVYLDPVKLWSYHLSINDIKEKIQKSNAEVGAGTLEICEKEFMIRLPGYIQSVEPIEKICLGVNEQGTPIFLKDIAVIQVGPQMRRGIADLNGKGEAVGGIVVVRYFADVMKVIERVKTILDETTKTFSPPINYTITYDRTALIQRSMHTLTEALIEESIAVGLVCALFLFHLRSVLVALIVLPISVLVAFLIMYVQGLSANIMSLGGIAIAIGAMVDAVIIMIENTHKHMEQEGNTVSHWEIITKATIEVGPALFYSLLVIAISFLPVFTLQAQEGRLFKPLAFTKTYSMAAAAFLSLTLAPILIGFFIRGRILPEEKNPVNRICIAVYHKLLKPILDNPLSIISFAVVLTLWVFFPWNWLVTERLPDGRVKALSRLIGRVFPYQNLGSEFMPPLYEGDLLYMPSTVPGISPTEGKALIQRTNKVIMTFPEVRTAFAKDGRAETATDPAPLDMMETTIQLKDESEWPKIPIMLPDGSVEVRRRTPEELISALNAALTFPGIRNAWTMPIKARIDMLSTGFKTPFGIKINGPDLAQLDRIGEEISGVINHLRGTTSVFADLNLAGNYIIMDVDRAAIARYGLTLQQVQEALALALSGEPISTTVEGLERYTIDLRYNRDFRDQVEKLRDILVPTPTGAQIPFGELGTLKVTKGPMSIKSEASVPSSWVYVDIAGIDLGTYVDNAKQAIHEAMRSGTIQLPSGYSLVWSGQYEFMARAAEQLQIAIPVTILLIFFLIYVNTGSIVKTCIVLCAIPFSLVGSFWFLYVLGYNLSVAVWVGIIALAGLSAETGVVMLLYLDLSYAEWQSKGLMRNEEDLKEAIYHGAAKRIRPKIMTASVILIGLLPVVLSHGTGADLMKRIAMPMIGGIITSTLMELIVFPAIYFMWRKRV